MAPVLTETIQMCLSEAMLHADAFYRDADFWNTLGRNVWQNPSRLARLSSWEEHVEYLRSWLIKSLAYLQTVYAP